MRSIRVWGLTPTKLPAVTQCPGPAFEALQQYHQNQSPSLGPMRVCGFKGVKILGGVKKLVASTCPTNHDSPILLREPSELGLPAGLLASPCPAQGVRGTVHIPVINMGTVDVLYPQKLGSVEVVSLPPRFRGYYVSCHNLFSGRI